ncbi:chromatin-remodeling ATPase INO80 [Macrosteles quadrilineatus]|uniref:chromatin-remodeling ATPase INO80 n=1 Tax=Macrosteles quadrilineatus TaxID=74068 RepID=UPI0023E1D83F|nr:chromatin-remodeling ATPase INO80 [Macrosteles quadrilineatus]
MTEENLQKMIDKEIAKPLYYQQLERSLDMQPFLSYVEEVFKQPFRNDEGSSDYDANTDTNFSYSQWERMNSTKQDRRSDKMRLYNFSHIQRDRLWLQNILVSDSSDSSEDEDDKPITEKDLQEMLKLHLYKKKYKKKFYTNPDNRQYQYYGAGLLSTYDKFSEHQTNVVGNKKKKKSFVIKKERIKKEEKETFNYHDEQDRDSIFEDGGSDGRFNKTQGLGGKMLKNRKKAQQLKNPEVMAHRRRKIWAIMAKKELGKVQRAKINNHKEVLTGCRRVAQYCMRYWRQKAMQSQKNMKETIWRAKRLSREMQSHWRRYDRVERETRRRMEKEAEEQRKMDVELMEAKRQQRKLNFLITQTELYAHFMSRKLGNASHEEQLRILSQLEEEKNPRLAAIDDYDSESMKEKVKLNVKSAFEAEEQRSRQFGSILNEPVVVEEERPQPAIFKGTLKGYQLKGMNWLANLYDQGINGILADEMGLGKTVQSIAFLCHIAEKYSVWGPFLIISPASTLHNWQQEMARFVPDFKVVPYWGSPQERKILRQFWDQKDLHTQEASFHVVITSYQLVITDFKYFNRIKWQYLILDEAQAIKSTSSVRWKLLLGFSCRNRLLLSGTPIQNSMAELWALLHFIMPTMFDSHDEFNEWFSKDIESHAENKTSIDERHLSRLHLILKPFMLRRIKKDVENELSDKIEIMVCCPLTTRQKVLYSALKKKIRIEDLLHSSGPYQSSQSITSSLMNLVMQFRKVCNHPELFERQEAKSPLWTQCGESLYVTPRLVFEEAMLHRALPSTDHLLYNLLSILHQQYVHQSLFSENEIDCSDFFGFSRLIGLSPEDVFQLTIGGLLNRWLSLAEEVERRPLLRHRQVWWERTSGVSVLVAPRSTTVPSELVFTNAQGHLCVFAHNTVTLHSTPETVEHRVMRCRKLAPQVETGASTSNDRVYPEFPHVERPPLVLECHPTLLPRFLYDTHPKVEAKTWQLYSSSRRAAWWLLAHQQCSTRQGLECVWYGSPRLAQHYLTAPLCFQPPQLGGLAAVTPLTGWSHISIPDKETLVTDCGKLFVLDTLLERLKQQGHRVLIYSQMTRMIDLLEEYMWHRKLTYMRLDGSSKISDRRDMVADFQARTDIFVFLLSTRAGGLGINLTAADTVIFYDSDWNPTVDQQAMDRAHRLGQTKQVTVYRLICKGTIEERILQRAREKSEIQRMVISGGNFKSDTLKPKEVVSLLLDDEEIEKKYRQKQAERRKAEEYKAEKEKEKERKRKQTFGPFKEPVKHIKLEEGFEEGFDSTPASPAQSEASGFLDDTSSDALVVDVDGPSNDVLPPVRSHGSKRGRPRGSRRGGLTRGAIQASSISLGVQGIKRGPGRPRLRPSGPGHVGGRGSPRQRGRGLGTTTTTTAAPTFGYYMQDLEIMPLDRDTS